MDTITNIFPSWPKERASDPDMDSFQAGIDSLQVINAAKLLRATLKSSGIAVNDSALSARVIYGHPTPKEAWRPPLLSFAR